MTKTKGVLFMKHCI